MSSSSRKSASSPKQSKTSNANVGSAAGFAHTFVAHLGEAQAEAAKLACRRARAWLELPTTMSNCRTLPDVATAQAEFAQHFWTDWASYNQRMASTWTQLWMVPVQMAATASEAVPQAVGDAADPMAVWEWWRTDLKAIVPRRTEADSEVPSRSGTH